MVHTMKNIFEISECELLAASRFKRGIVVYIEHPMSKQITRYKITKYRGRVRIHSRKYDHASIWTHIKDTVTDALVDKLLCDSL